MRRSSCCAWDAVLGNPSRMKLASGSSDVCGGTVVSGESRKESISKSTEDDESVIVAGPPGGSNQPRVLSSLRISRRIMSSGTRAPLLMVDSAFIPRGVRAFTLERNRSPEEIEESWGKRSRSRDACVPLPTPGGSESRMFATCFTLNALRFPDYGVAYLVRRRG